MSRVLPERGPKGIGAARRRRSRLQCSMGCAVAAGLKLVPRGGSRSCRSKSCGRRQRKVVFVGVQSAARARPQKYRGCATEALADTVQHRLRGGCWFLVRAERRLEIVSTGCDTSGDAGAVAVKSSAARVRPQKYRGCATEALAATVQHGLRGAAGLQLEPRGGSRSCRRGVTRAATRARSP